MTHLRSTKSPLLARVKLGSTTSPQGRLVSQVFLAGWSRDGECPWAREDARGVTDSLKVGSLKEVRLSKARVLSGSGCRY